MTIKETTIIYTDGACFGNPGKGGAAAILSYKEHQKTLLAYLPIATNNQMELIACIIALRALKKATLVDIFTDSIYVKNGITNWIHLWEKNNWRTSSKQPVKNIKLWQLLLDLTRYHKVNWHWVKSHNGNPQNEEADKKAKEAITTEAPLIKEFLYLSVELGYKEV